MFDYTVEVTPVVMGNSPSAPPPAIAFRYHSETISVRALIQRAVTAQITTLREQHARSHAEIRQILARQYLAGEEITAQAEQGAVKMPAAAQSRAHAPDPEQEVARALAGFEQGRFFITVNGYQPDSLEQRLLLTQYSKVLFLRLTPLVGG